MPRASAIWIGAALAAWGCQDRQSARGACVLDTDCPEGTVCDPLTGDCVAEPPPDCVPTEETGGVEACDGLDNDCDGQTDERGDLAGAGVVGVLCGESAGACEQGIRECEGGELVCAQSVGPQEERCDGDDNDCDGLTDEGFDLGVACSAGTGECLSRGVSVCAGDGDSTTCSAPLRDPAFEECDGIDNDCDGETDEKFALGDPCSEGLGACFTEGIVVCDALGRGACNALPPPPEEESCDGVDNDCDGRTDEGFGLGGACESGVGACRAAGVVRCDDGGKAFCDAVLGPPSDEVCDLLDNDCDGLVDEELGLGDACFAGQGGCRREGALVCGDGAVVCTAEAEVQALEVCDGVDNDCDGDVDEGYDIGAPCEIGVGACRSLGLWRCGPGGGRVCGAPRIEGAQERCNGLDDDCDGAVDQRFDVGTVCMTGRGECRAAGVRVCAGDFGTRCDADMPPPADETCDGLDNDCDDDVDEGFDLGRACFDGVGECLSVGERVCDGRGRARCSAVPGPPEPERCNDADDDCDGLVDEDFDLGRACTNGVGACVRAGARVCHAAGHAVCDAVPGPPGLDACNGLDDDCDGLTDEQGPDLLAGCAPPPDGVASCDPAGQCVFACEPGRRDVNGDFSQPGGDGCEGRDWAILGAGIYFTCGLLTDGTLRCWGANDKRQARPPQGRFRALGVGFDHACAVALDPLPGADGAPGEGGAVACWGDNDFGQAATPVGGYVAVAAGRDHTCALRPGGAPRCWGSNVRGQLAAPLGVQFEELSAGADHTCGLTAAGDVICWGSNGSGQALAPPGPFAAMAAGSDHTCAIRPDGHLECWGLDRDGQASPPPELDGIELVAVSAGYRNTCVLTLDGGLACWGAAEFGQLPAPRELTWERIAVGRYHTCGIPDSEDIVCWGADDVGQGRAPAGPFDTIAGGARHFCGIRPDSSVGCWGDGALGQTNPRPGRYTSLSSGDDYTCGLREDLSARCWGAVPPGGGTLDGRNSAISAGGAHICTLDTQGLAFCWGDNTFGQARAPLRSFRQIAAGDAHTCAIRLDRGDAQCWGSNAHGQASPPQTAFRSLASGSLHTCGLTADGHVQCWGFLGATQNTPAAEVFTAVTARFHLTCGLRPDGSTTCWGNARQGQGTLDGGPYVAVAAGGYNLCAVALDGTVECSPNVVTEGGRSE